MGMHAHHSVPASATRSASRSERKQAPEAPAPAAPTHRAAEGARTDLPVHDFSRMSIGERSTTAFRPAPERKDAGAMANNTGLPGRLKAGVENLSGFAMDDVRVHFHSSKPVALHALAYTQGSDIHVGPGQERHLPHEAWHVAQQKQGRVKPTLQMKGVAINDDAGLEREADAMGARSLAGQGEQSSEGHLRSAGHTPGLREAVTQRQLTGEEGAETPIKIAIISTFEEGVIDIKTVYLAEKWTSDSTDVYFYSAKLTSQNKKSRKRERIKAHLAFSGTATDSMIKAEIEQVEEADTAADKLGVPDAVIDHLLKVVRENKKEYKLEIEPDRAKIILMLEQFSDLAEQVKVEQPKGKKGAAAQQELREAREKALEDLKGLLAGEAKEKKKFWLDTIMETMTHTGPSSKTQGASAGGGGGTNTEWKTERTSALKKDLLEAISGQKSGLIDNDNPLHHKMSRARLKRLMALLNESPSSPGVDATWKFISGLETLTHTGDRQKALENWTANLELGINKRKDDDDPGDVFDGNYPGGTATPRTQNLEEVNSIISKATHGKDVPWDEVASLLTQTRLAHVAATSKLTRKEEAFTDPDLTQWKDTSGGWVREKKKADAASQGGQQVSGTSAHTTTDTTSATSTTRIAGTASSSTTSTTSTTGTGISSRSVRSGKKRGK